MNILPQPSYTPIVCSCCQQRFTTTLVVQHRREQVGALLLCITCQAHRGLLIVGNHDSIILWAAGKDTDLWTFSYPMPEREISSWRN